VKPSLIEHLAVTLPARDQESQALGSLGQESHGKGTHGEGILTDSVAQDAQPVTVRRRTLGWVVGGLLLAVAVVVAVTVQPRLDPVPTVVPTTQVQVPMVPVEPQIAATEAPILGAIREPGSERTDGGMFGLWVSPTSVAGQTVGRIVDAGQAVVQEAAAHRIGLKVVGFLRPDTRTVAESLFGLANGDVILSYDGIEVSSIDALNAIHLAHHAGDEVTLLVLRAGVEQVLHGKLGRVTALGAL